MSPPRCDIVESVSRFPFFQRVSQAPTAPRSAPTIRSFDVAELYEGPIPVGGGTDTGDVLLDEKLRQAYFWIVNTAIISPHYDIEYQDGPSPEYRVGDSRRLLTLPSTQSYSSHVLLPLLAFATQGKCLFVGGPGRGKTASALRALFGDMQVAIEPIAGDDKGLQYISDMPEGLTG